MKLTDYEIIRHGVEHSDYFQGCGVSFTRFDHVCTGIGDTEAEAFNDALDSVAQGHSFDIGEIERVEKENTEWSEEDVQTAIGATDEEMEDNDQPPYWHVSIRYNVFATDEEGQAAHEEWLARDAA